MASPPSRVSQRPAPSQPPPSEPGHPADATPPDHPPAAHLSGRHGARSTSRIGVRLSSQRGAAPGSQITVQAGQTYDLPAVLAASVTLVADAGSTTNTPAMLQVAAGSTTASHGAIVLQGGRSASYLGTPGSGGPGATLLISGTLANTGPVTVGGGQNGTYAVGGQGAALINAGVLTNAGYIKVAGGYGGFGAGAAGGGGSGALLSNTGVLTNSGTLLLATSVGGSDPLTGGGTGATLVDSGVLTNTGLVQLRGDFGPASLTITADGAMTNAGSMVLYSSADNHVNGALLANDGTLDNTGTIALGGEGNSLGGVGATLLDTGYLTNSGVIEVAGAFYFGDLYGGPATLEVSGTLYNLGSIQLPASNYGITPGQMFITATGTLLTSGAVTGSGDLINAGVILGDPVSLDTITLATLTNDGTIVSGEDMKLTGAITADPGFSGQIQISDAGILVLDGAVSASETVTFDTQAGRLFLAEPSSFAAPIDGFAAGDILDLTGLAFVAGHMSESFAAGVLTVSDGTQADSFALNGVPDDTQFSVRNDGSPSHGTLIEQAAQCYVPGTRLRTDRGTIAIEDLTIGDRLVTLHGGSKQIRWIGHRSYDGRFIAGNHLMLPVCIKADALAPHVPIRDLRVSPGHGVYIDGALIPAWRLVNGITITQDATIDRVSYIHVELAEHEIVFAEGLPAETYLDEGCRTQFANAADFHALYPEHAAHLRPTPCVPRIEDGFQLHAIQQRLALRAGIATAAAAVPGKLRGYLEVAGPDVLVGWAQDAADPEHPVCLDVVVDGRRVLRLLANRYRADVRAAGLGSGCHGFDLQFGTPIRGHINLHRAGDGALLDRTGFMAAGSAV